LKPAHDSQRGRTLYDHLSSVRLTILLCIALALASVLGTLLPQNQQHEHYVQRYGSTLARLLETLGLFDLYHSAWFVGLLSLLALNLTVCTMRRLPTVWRAVRRDLQPPTLEALKNWKQVSAVAFEANPEGVDKALREAAGRLFRRPRYSTRDGIRFYGAQRGRFSRFGPYVTHASVLLILLGAVIGSLAGFKGFVIVGEGGTFDAVELQPSGVLRPLGFTVHCTRFIMTSYPDGTPKEYRSEIVIRDGQGRILRDGPVRVNHPLSYNGITFYQSSYQSIPEVTFSVRENATGRATTVTAKLNSPFPVGPEGRTRAMLLSFDPDFQMPQEMAHLLQAPRRGMGPAAQLVMLKERGTQEVFWVFKNFPDFNKGKEDTYSFEIADYKMYTYTGLQVVKDPGTPVIWAGCVLMVLGFLLSFFFDHEIIWIALDTQSGHRRGTILFAGRAIRHPASYGGRFAGLVRTFEQRLAPFLHRTSSSTRQAGHLEGGR